MAKGQVSEEDLELGVKAAGGFLGLTKARRDSPFGAEHVKRELEPIEKTITLNVEKPKETVEKPQVTIERPKEAIELKRVSEKVTTSNEKVSKIKVEVSKTKAEKFSEKITLNISPEMRDKAEMLARSLQRKKNDKSERITANTIYRVAIKALLENKDFIDADSPNTEGELLELVKGKK